MKKMHFNILDCNAVKELLDLLDLEEGMHYFKARTPNGFTYYRIILDNADSIMAYELLKDIDIYLPHIKLYLTDYLLLKKEPIKDIITLLDMFNVDQLFEPFLNRPKLIRLKREANNNQK